MKENITKHGVSLVILALFGLLAVGTTDTDTDTKRVLSQVPSYTVSADQLYNDYNSNEVAADAKYKGKIVLISGIIQDIGKDIMGQAYVVIGGKGFIDGVQCLFTKGEEFSVARLSKGESVTIKGEVEGKMGNVLVRKATLQ